MKYNKILQKDSDDFGSLIIIDGNITDDMASNIFANIIY